MLMKAQTRNVSLPIICCRELPDWRTRRPRPDAALAIEDEQFRASFHY
jgi:hypothetical protein